MKKINILKIAVLVFLLGTVVWFQTTLSPMITADSAVSQLEDSDEAYLGFKFTQQLPLIAWGAWLLLALSMYYKQIANLFKGDKKK